MPDAHLFGVGWCVCYQVHRDGGHLRGFVKDREGWNMETAGVAIQCISFLGMNIWTLSHLATSFHCCVVIASMAVQPTEGVQHLLKEWQQMPALCVQAASGVMAKVPENKDQISRRDVCQNVAVLKPIVEHLGT